MREILFRGKTKTGVWVEGFYYHLKSRYKGDKTFIYDSHMITTGIEETSGAYGESTEFIEHKVIPETVGQYTGKDLCDKKLFEGDIVEWYEDYDDSFGYSKTAYGYSVVVWDNENYCWSFKTDNEYIQPFNDWNWENCFIIGNIHDNPELLKGGEE